MSFLIHEDITHHDKHITSKEKDGRNHALKQVQSDIEGLTNTEQGHERSLRQIDHLDIRLPKF